MDTAIFTTLFGVGREVVFMKQRYENNCVIIGQIFILANLKSERS